MKFEIEKEFRVYNEIEECVICSYYQKGICSYGSQCRYEHVKASQLDLSASSKSMKPHQFGISGSVPQGPSTSKFRGSAVLSATSAEFPGSNGGSGNLADRSICTFAASGNCPRGETCPHIHGDSVPPAENIATAAERKFGLLSECDHRFCISCIRNWRSSSPSSGMDVNTALRACPICRKLSYFVIPSVIWYSTPEEKQGIVDSYKAKLRSIDCNHFNFGNGNCPFGTSCFYKPTVKPGSYAWKYHKPPPRRSNVIDMDTIFYAFKHLIEEDGLNIFDDEDLENDAMSMEMALFLMELDCEPSDSSSDEEDFHY
ncbi:Zinc finger family protein isoform 2 [Hibiscus syriacus]|uniref:Zinc finger family protein isoform 2 n=1 Tax=Hibiscus syriacus TaxID=106335 RepID=A0A6A2XUH8_HIBSY|nr:Zinc finger family protein isoform 2 [Hibiscus syriacus]